MLGLTVMPTDGLKPETWTLQTADTRVEVTVENARPVIATLSKVGNKHNWAAGPMPQPIIGNVWVAGVERPVVWQFEGGTQDKKAGTLTLRFACVEPRLELRSVWRARPGHGPVEHWVEIENRSRARVTVPQQESLVLGALDTGGQADLWWIKRGGSNASTEGGTFTEAVRPGMDLSLNSNCEDGSSPVPWMAVQVGESHGLYVGWEFSGLGRIHAKAGKDLAIAIGNHPDFKTDIEPGETLLVPAAFVGCYSGDIDEGSYSLHRFVIEKLRPSVPKTFPDPILAYNIYLQVGEGRATEQGVMREFQFCKDLGFECCVPDAMWFPACGDWRWDPARFPHGVDPIERWAHANGLKMGLWCAWTNGGLSDDPGALSVRKTPDWFRGTFAADWQPGPFYGANLCLGCEPAKEWEVKKTQWLAERHKLDYLKHDCGPIVTTCDKTDHRHHYGSDASYWATMGYYEVQEKLRKAFPNLVLENCSGGGHIKDFGVIQRTHYTVTTDTLSNLPDRQAMYDTTFALPPLVNQLYTYDNAYHVPGDEPGPFLWRSGMMGAWQIDPTDTPKWTEEEYDSAKASTRLYREWIRPILRDCKVHHILPRPDGKHWDGLFYWSAPLGKGVLFVFRPDSPDGSWTVKLKGLEPELKYWVWSEDGSVPVGQRTGKWLMEQGIRVELPDTYTCDVVMLQAGASPDLSPPGPFGLKKPLLRSDVAGTIATLGWTESKGARRYDLLVTWKDSDAREQTEAGMQLVRTSVDVRLWPDREHRWRVVAHNWGGHTPCAAEGTFRTPPPKQHPGVVFISDIPWVSATAGAGNLPRRDTNYYGKAVVVSGKECLKAVWTHSFENETPADIVIGVAGHGPSTLVADAGLDGSSGGGSVQFVVVVDGVERARSAVLRPGEVHHFSVDVANARRLTLRVLNGGDGNTCDHAAWGMARLVSKGATDPFPRGR